MTEYVVAHHIELELENKTLGEAIAMLLALAVEYGNDAMLKGHLIDDDPTLYNLLLVKHAS